MTIIDVSVPFDSNLPTYPGNPSFSLGSVRRIRARHFFDDGGAPLRVTLRRI